MRLSLFVSWCVTATTGLGPAAALAGPEAGVAVIRTVAWSPGDSAREGAGEFLVLLQAAKLQQTSRAAGVVAVGDHNGTLRSGGERALRRLALTGVVVAKTARGGSVAATPENLFIDARQLEEDTARRVLLRGLDLYGAPPTVADPERPTATELAAIRGHLEKFQVLFAVEASPAVALGGTMP